MPRMVRAADRIDVEALVAAWEDRAARWGSPPVWLAAARAGAAFTVPAWVVATRVEAERIGPGDTRSVRVDPDGAWTFV